MKKFNLHSHSTFCDGKSSLEQMVLSAIEKGLYCFGFSAHAPVPFDNTFALQYSDKEAYLCECARLKAAYADRIRIFSSLSGAQRESLKGQLSTGPSRLLGFES